MKTIWVSPTEFVSGDPTLVISPPSASHPGSAEARGTTGTPKFVFMGVPLPANIAIEEVIITYETPNPGSFINKIILGDSYTPDHAQAFHEDNTELKSMTPTSYTSKLGIGGFVPPAAVSLSLQLNFANDHDPILLGAVGVSFESLTPSCVNSIANLKALGAGAVPCLTVLGYDAPGDGGGGTFFWDNSFNLDVSWKDDLGVSWKDDGEDGGTVIKPNALLPSQAGRWRRMFSGALSVKWFGAKGNASGDALKVGKDDTKAIKNAIAVAGSTTMGTVYFPCAQYRVTSTLKLPGGVRLVGDAGVHGLNSVIKYEGEGNCIEIRSTSGNELRDLTIARALGSGGDGIYVQAWLDTSGKLRQRACQEFCV